MLTYGVELNLKTTVKRTPEILPSQTDLLKHMGPTATATRVHGCARSPG